MAKETKPAAEAEGDQTTHVAMKKTDFDDCKRIYKSANKKIDEERERMGEYLADAKENKRLHPKAFRAAMAIHNMKEPARSEYLFQLGTYLKWLEVFASADMLADRQPAEGDDDKRDLRPRHLRDAESQIAEAAGKAHKGSASPPGMPPTAPDDRDGEGEGTNDLTHH